MARVAASAGHPGPLVVGISGVSRSGKSRLARRLQQLLGGQAICQDAFWRQCWPVTAAGREWLSQEAPECTDWDAFDRAVAAALAELTSAPTTGHQRPLLFLEGFQLLHDERIAGRLDVCFHLELPCEEAVQRRSSPDDPKQPNPNPMPRDYCECILWPTQPRVRRPLCRSPAQRSLAAGVRRTLRDRCPAGAANPAPTDSCSHIICPSFSAHHHCHPYQNE
eukprot:EG_transcript_28880